VSSQEPTEEQLQEALRRLRVEDVLLQTVVTLVNLTGRRLTAEGEQDLEQAKRGIDAVRALLPLCPQEEAAAVKDALAQLQMLYVRAAGAAPGEAAEPASAEGAGASSQEQAERAKARAKIWTPPGASS
jgi:hypothetical protein